MAVEKGPQIRYRRNSSFRKGETIYRHPVQTLVSSEEAEEGIRLLSEELGRFIQSKGLKKEECLVIPILRGGKVMGDEFVKALGLDSTNMRISRTIGTEEREPVCTMQPDIDALIGKKLIIFAEAIVDSGTTIAFAEETIKTMLVRTGQEIVPEFATFAFATKLPDDVKPTSTVVAAFEIDSSVWVFGEGCDAFGLGRKLLKMMGYIPEKYQKHPRLRRPTRNLLRKDALENVNGRTEIQPATR